ncbi:AlbA family DNA-binding domain-containing protein [Variovorax sp. LT1P1]|uniref:AlbA family DNA-binding domain-containing protein n=1 Tax=Variovorax sp. LT1P1 TaxID=3443730 RepID=UPI003F45375B
MLPTNLLTVAQADLERLITDRTSEGQHLDFKRDVPKAWGDGPKQELAADVCAFANSGGGDIIFGIDEQDGVAAALCPQPGSNVDADIRRMQDIISSGLEPRVPGVQVLAVAIEQGDETGIAIIVRVPQSVARPHRTRLKLDFYIREGLKKRPIDVPEIRGFFLRTEAQAQRLRDFRSDRLGLLLTGQAPVPIAAGPLLVLHVFPVQALGTNDPIDVVPYGHGGRELPTLAGGKSASNVIFNFEGVCGTHGSGEHMYTQLFRDGSWEAVWVQRRLGEGTVPALPSPLFEQWFVQFLQRARAELRHWQMAQDLIVLLSLVRADDLSLSLSDGHGFHNHYPFRRATMLAPDLLIEGEADLPSALRPLFDLVHQGAGQKGCPYYDEAGKWTGAR